MICIEGDYLVGLKVTTIDQQTTVVGKEPLKELKTFRAGPLLANIRAMKNEVCITLVNISKSLI